MIKYSRPLSSLFKFAAIALTLALAVGLSACAPVKQEDATGEDKDIHNKIGKNLNRTYTLEKVMYADGKTEYVVRNDVLLKLTAANKLEGQMICNAFSASVEWSTDGTITLTAWEKKTRPCSRPDPVSFELKMKYEFNEDSIILKNTSHSWAAYFTRL